MRYAFVQELTTLAQKNQDIILLTADLGYTVFEEFVKKYPKQFFNVGVGESNLISIAAGLALSRKIVFAYSIATFATFRPYEFIRNDICMHKAPVIIVGSGAGFSYGDAGPTHFALQDIAIMRSLPNITILCPADPIETRWATREAVKLKSPVYLRLGKKDPQIHTHQHPTLKTGRGKLITEGDGKLAILATGNIVSNAQEAANLLKQKGIAATLVSMHTIKPIDKNLIRKLAISYKLIVTIEEHSIIGGLGSAVAEIISQIPKSKAQLQIFGTEDTFQKRLGGQTYLRKIHGLSSEKIAKRILNLISK